MKNADRALKTKKLIFDTYMNIVEREGMSKVTVSKLCQEADISRPTFYNYYSYLEEPLDDALQELYSKINAETIQRLVFDLDDEYIIQYANYYKDFSPILRKLMNGKSPEFEYYLQGKLFRNIKKPKDYDTDYIAQVSYELMNAIQYTVIKFVIFNPDVPDEVILSIHKSTNSDFASREYIKRFAR